MTTLVVTGLITVYEEVTGACVDTAYEVTGVCVATEVTTVANTELTGTIVWNGTDVGPQSIKIVVTEPPP